MFVIWGLMLLSVLGPMIFMLLSVLGPMANQLSSFWLTYRLQTQATGQWA